jgi:hypothetical protein
MGVEDRYVGFKLKGVNKDWKNSDNKSYSNTYFQF